MAIAFNTTYAPPSDAGGHDIFWFAEQVAARVNEQIGAGAPDGGVYHAEGPTADGLWWSFDVWESSDAKTAFESSILNAVFSDLGITVASETGPLEVWWESLQMTPPS